MAPLGVLSPACQKLTFTAHADKVTGEFVGLKKGDTDDPAHRSGRARRLRLPPQIVGVFTDLSGPHRRAWELRPPSTPATSLAPAPLKMAAMVLGLLSTLVALIALHILDTSDGTRHRRLLPARWWSVSTLDGLVVAVLVWWHFVGANTSDDGYILTMARVSGSGYMASFYRWFGTPRSPFGWYTTCWRCGRTSPRPASGCACPPC